MLSSVMSEKMKGTFAFKKVTGTIGHTFAGNRKGFLIFSLLATKKLKRIDEALAPIIRFFIYN